MNTENPIYDLGLIIPTREEFDYIGESVTFAPVFGQDKGFWYQFSLPGGRLGIAHVLFDMGLTTTAAATMRLLTKFDPEILAVVGIGGGLSSDLRLGDVVVGSVIQEYLKAAKVVPDGPGQSEFKPAGAGWPLAERLRNFTNHFQYYAKDCHERWARYARIRGAEAELRLVTTPGARGEPVYHVLPIASGDLVVADPAFRNWLLSHDRKRAVIEMEGAGAARAVTEYDRDVALLVLRGISDFADEKKSALDSAGSDSAGSDSAGSGPAGGAWRRYAAQNAIELLFAFLASPSFPWRSAPRRPADPQDAGVPDLTARPPRSAWEYFMAAAQLGGAAATGLEILHSHHHHAPHAAADGEHHGSGWTGDDDHLHQHGREDAAHGLDHDHHHDMLHEADDYDDAQEDVSRSAATEPDPHAGFHPFTDPHHS
jgi:nucleoside phosphorylase